MIEHAALSSDVLEAAREAVRSRTGLVFGESRRSSFAAAITHAMRQSRLSDHAAFLSRLAADPVLLDDLVAEITVGETYFFRDPQQFASIVEEIIPALRAGRPPDRGLRVWSAGCASGEETYSLAIALKQLDLLETSHLVGTDICRSVLSRARRARYGRWSFRGVSKDVMEAFFTRTGEQFDLSERIRDRVEFRYLNLAEDEFPSLASGTVGMDLILCRNVLIYFDDTTVVRVARRLIDSLSEDGWLVLGASDPPLGGLVPCDVVITRAGLAYRKPQSARSAAMYPGHPSDRAAAPDLSEAPWDEDASQALPPVPSMPSRQPELLLPAFGERNASRLSAVESAASDAAAASRPGGEDITTAFSYYAQREYALAAELASRLVSADGSDPEIWIVLVRALANRGELDEAGRSCAAALDRHRTSAELTYLHALLLGEAGRHAEAAAAARRALYLDPELAVAHMALGSALSRFRDVVAARRAFRNAQRLLSAMDPDAVPRASDGEPAWRLRERADVQLRLVIAGAA